MWLKKAEEQSKESSAAYTDSYAIICMGNMNEER